MGKIGTHAGPLAYPFAYPPFANAQGERHAAALQRRALQLQQSTPHPGAPVGFSGTPGRAVSASGKRETKRQRPGRAAQAGHRRAQRPRCAAFGASDGPTHRRTGRAAQPGAFCAIDAQPHTRAHGTAKNPSKVGAPGRGRWAGPGTLATVRPLFNSGAPGLFRACLSGDGTRCTPAQSVTFSSLAQPHARAWQPLKSPQKSARRVRHFATPARAWVCPEMPRNYPARKSRQGANE